MEWISVEDRLPEDDEWQLVWLSGEHYPRRGAYHAEKRESPRWYVRDWDWVDIVTHWMPLPDPPQERL